MSQVGAITNVHSKAGLQGYLKSILGYQTTDVPYSSIDLGIPSKPSEAISSASLLSDYNKGFQIYLFETNSVTRTTIRSILEPFYRQHPAGNYLFIFTTDYKQLFFVSPLRILRPGKPGVTLQLRILPIDPENVYHTDMQVLNSITLGAADNTAEAICEKHNEAFSIERVTESFFKTYEVVIDNLKRRLSEQKKGNADQAQGFALQLLNRLMFLYFLQKKDWLEWGDGTPDKRYVRTLWQKYRKAGKREVFYQDYLQPLFLYAFNNRQSELPREVNGEAKASFLRMPYLNGGLFAENDLDRLGFYVPDEVFVTLFDKDVDEEHPGFLERYNFTIQESLPLEVEVAVDPQMLGMVYESFINEADRHQGGVFYTPRIEIDYMCRLSIIDYLHGDTGYTKDALIPFVMTPYLEEVYKAFSKEQLQKLWTALEQLRVVDPAVGSGSFLVGMMNIMVQLFRGLAERLGRTQNEFALKRKIIQDSLYGVDVKDWAVRICELRLWLSLTIESDERQIDPHRPVLPNLTFKIRQGDSLIEEAYGEYLAFRGGSYHNIAPSLQKKVQKIATDKEKFYQGDHTVTQDGILQSEKDLLLGVIDAQVKAIDIEVNKLEAPDRQAFQTGLEQIRGGLDITGALLKKLEEERAKKQPQIDALQAEKAGLIGVEKSIHTDTFKNISHPYFLWGVSFTEVFLEKGGFDIVIGNPPYVRQEEIAPPLEKEPSDDADKWREIKRTYKDRLETGVKSQWAGAVTRVDKKSDLYIYFYYQGMSLLRPRGVFCFINSNSWLDVGYGAGLQEFLLRNMMVEQVIDNRSFRSFKADVNTVIVLIKRPEETGWEKLKDSLVKFVAYKIPFEAGVVSDNLELIEMADGVESRSAFRVYPIKQEELLADGMKIPDEEKEELKLGKEYGKYEGGKWGGKYLRAPDIFFTILEKGKGKLVKLGEIAEVKRGFTTGANEFFYLEPTGKPAPKGLLHVRNGAGWEGLIEEEFLKPVVKSPKEVKSIFIQPEDLQYKVFMCHREKHELKETCALKYITWGEVQEYDNRPSCCGRPRWWDMGEQEQYDFVMLRFRDQRNWTPLLKRGYFIGDVVFVGKYYEREYCNEFNSLLNSTLHLLTTEILGRVNLGEGLLTTYGPEILRFLVFQPSTFNASQRDRLVSAFNELIKRDIKPFCEELGLPKPNRDFSNIHPEDVSLEKVLPDRRALDKVVFEAIGLTEPEQLEVYWAVVTLVKDRLSKARSMK